MSITLNRNRSCRREHHTINDMGHTVRSHVVGSCHLLQAVAVCTHKHTLCILDHIQRLTFDGSNSLVSLQVSGQNLRGDDMKHQNVCKLALVLRFQQTVQGAIGQSTESSLVGAKTVNGPGELNVATKSAATTAATSVLKSSTD